MSLSEPRSELLSLLAAIKADPDEDTPKLALADWLQEQDYAADRARGEYVRALLSLDGMATEHVGRPALLAQLSNLWKNHPAWLGPLPAAGFRFGHTMARWGLLFPAIDGVHLASKRTLAVVGSEEYAWVGGLSLTALTEHQHQRFIHSRLVESLIGLRYDRTVTTPAPIVGLARSADAATLKSLVLSECRIGIEGTAALSGSAGSSSLLSALRELSLGGCDIGSDAGVRSLCESPVLNDLRLLDASGTGLSLHSARSFADAAGLPSLVALELGGNQIGPDGALILVHKPNSGRLQQLGLRANGIADYGVEAICRAGHLCNLTHLDLSANLLTARAARALAEAQQLQTLEVLALRQNQIDGEGGLALAAAQHLRSLQWLDLRGNPLDRDSVAALRDRFGDRVKVS